MFGLGMPELIIVLTLAMIFFGAGKLPELGTGLGTAIRNFRKGVSDAGSGRKQSPEAPKIRNSSREAE